MGFDFGFDYYCIVGKIIQFENFQWFQNFLFEFFVLFQFFVDVLEVLYDFIDIFVVSNVYVYQVIIEFFGKIIDYSDFVKRYGMNSFVQCMQLDFMDCYFFY